MGKYCDCCGKEDTESKMVEVKDYFSGDRLWLGVTLCEGCELKYKKSLHKHYMSLKLKYTIYRRKKKKNNKLEA